MNTNLIKTVIRSCVVVGLFTVLSGAWPREASAQTPAQATFADSAGDKIRSDGLGTYADDELDVNSCVRSWVTTNRPGAAFMRTGQHPDFCDRPAAPDRTLILDFGDPVGACPVLPPGPPPLDVCGLNIVPDARIVADAPNPFYSGTTASDVNVKFNLSTAFPNNTFDFILEFDNLVPVSGSGLSRTLTAGSGATATLYWNDNANPNKPKKRFVATYRMPFSVTYTKSQ